MSHVVQKQSRHREELFGNACPFLKAGKRPHMILKTQILRIHSDIAMFILDICTKCTVRVALNKDQENSCKNF